MKIHEILRIQKYCVLSPILEIYICLGKCVLSFLSKYEKFYLVWFFKLEINKNAISVISLA